MKRKKISAIIACFNDGDAIPLMHKRLTNVFLSMKEVDYEILFVNDGSPDDTELVLKKIIKKDPHTIAINHSRNFSSQMAFTSGMELATGDAIILFDGDLQDPPELIPQLYAKWIEGFDVVYGIRMKREAPIWMQISYKIFYRVFHKLSYIKIPLDAGDFSLIDRKVVEVLKLFPEKDRFLRGLRAWVGFNQTGIQYIRPERLFGKTTNSIFKNFQWATKGILSFSYVPLQLMTIFSLGIFFLAIFALLFQIITKIFWPQSAPQGITTVLTAILVLGSTQLLFISVIGEYIGKIFEEVKQRPKFIVKNILRHDNIPLYPKIKN